MSTQSARPVIVGYEDDPAGNLALEWAVREAKRQDLPVHALVVTGLSYAVPPGYGAASTWPEEADEQTLETARARVAALDPGEHAVTRTSVGTPAAALVTASDQASMVVVGRHRRSPLGELVAGSTSTQVAAHASAPVVVVDADSPTDAQAPIVVAVDGSPANEAALAFAFERAAAMGAPVVTVHAWHIDIPTTYSAAWLTEEYVAEVEATQSQILDDAVDGWSAKYPGVEVRKVLRRDLPVDAVLGEAEGAQLIVVGSRGRGGFAGLLLGSVSQGLLHRHQRSCPLAVVHAARK